MSDNTQNKKELYNSLQGKKVFIPCRLEENQNITFELLINENEETMIPAFFDKDSAEGKFDLEKLIELEFSMLRNILIELPDEISGIVIEPFRDNIILNREALGEYDSATQGMTVKKVAHDKVTYMPVNGTPAGLAEALAEFLEGEIGVNAVWTIFAQNEDERIPHLAFAIDYIGSKFELFPKLAEVIKPFMQPGQAFELADRNPNMGPYLTEQNCIYKRNASVQ